MNSQNKLINDILSTYNNILHNKCIVEASDVYDNVDFKDNVVGNSKPSRDDINVVLLQDIEKAAKAAGVKVDITTAITGHKKGTRHETGNAVDIAIINDKAVSSSNRNDAEKLVNELIKMGYVKNREDSSTPKSVLTFGFSGHDNHIHISNTTSSPSKTTDSNLSTTIDSNLSTTTNSTSDSEEPNFAREIGKSLLQSIGINESLDYKSLGNKVSLRSGNIILPKENNSRIKSPVSGVVSNYFNTCDGLTIKFEIKGDIFYINYCGVESTDFRVGQKIKKGEIISHPESDVRVSIYNSKGSKEYNNKKNKSDSGGGFLSLFKINNKSTNTPEKEVSPDYSHYKNELSRELIKIKDDLFKVNKKDKIEENIKRIKGLL